MDEKSELLNQLRIDRSAPTQATRPRSLLWAGLCALALLLVAFGAWRVVGHGASSSVAQAAAAPPTATAAGAQPPPSSLLEASGYVVARRTATVSATIPGRVTEVLVDEGSRVEKGQVVAKLDDSAYIIDRARAKAQLEQAKAQVNSAEIALAGELPIFQRIEKQRAGGFISAQDLDTATATVNELRAAVEVAHRGVDVAQSTLEAVERNLRETVVRAPFRGVITFKGAQPGEIVSPAAAGGGFTRTGIGTIVDMDSLEVEVDVSENFITRVHAGRPATVKLNAYADWDIPAEVIAIIPTADRAKATVKVRVGFKVKDPRILPEMGAHVAFKA